ncbi:serine/threonine-protein kinase ULK4-like [Watersipora subatra]|uniref:serine/threonine-protein kinase ULK4-like n=1 Tax=Watersipora subatra TaxID=2589382 RepID=UPI00355B8E7A
MENFVLYDEIGKTDNCIIYKGRRKGTVVFLAIYCVEKSRRAEITNQVRLTHEIKHSHIQQFYEWYETTNHLWLVLELCNGGTLEKLLEQDGALPETCVRQFGQDLVEGLHGIHSLGMLFCDLRPSKLLLDGSGIIKFSDFSLARIEGENLDELLGMFGEQSGEEEADYDSTGDQGPKSKGSNKGSAHYMAPEVIQGGPHTMSSDIWSLGCVLYELFTGCKPFEAENFSELVNKIIHLDLPPPSVKGSRLSAKPSPDLVDLITGLLKKDPSERSHWEEIILHPFWNGKLKHLSSESELAVSTDMKEVRCTTPLSKRSSSTLLEHTKTGSVLGYIKDVEMRQSLDRPLTALLAETQGGIEGNLSESLRPRSRQGGSGGDMDAAKFTMSSRPLTSQGNRADEGEIMRKDESGGFNALEIVYYTSDWIVSNISDNNKIQKLPPLKYDQKSLQLPGHSVAKLSGMNKKDCEKHLTTLADLLSMEEKGPPTQKRGHLLTYATIVSANTAFAEYLVRRNLIFSLTKQLKDANHIDTRMKISRLIGSLAQNCDDSVPDSSYAEAAVILTDMLRENFRNAKLKSVLLPALGEIVFLIARVSEHCPVSVKDSNKSAIPSLTFTMILKCLKEGDDIVTHHYAAKTIENIVATNTDVCQKFVTNEVGQSLWYLCTHSSVDSPRITALSALCRITKNSIGVFESVIEKVGFPNLLNTISSSSSSRIQQAYVTMLCEAVSRGQHKQKYLIQKELFTTALHLLESTSSVVRGKTFVLIYIIIQEDSEQLLNLCQSRLIMYMERDKKKQHQTDKPEQWNQIQYLNICLNSLLTEVTRRIPLIVDTFLQLLNSISGRKHLSAAQGKQVKHLLPVVNLLQPLVSSSVFRPYIVNEEFILCVARLLEHTVMVDSGETGLSSSGNVGVPREEFVHSVLSVMETIMQQPALIATYQNVMTSEIAQSLSELCLSEQGESKLLSLKLFCELASVFSQTEYLTESQQKGADKMVVIVRKDLLPQFEQLLMDLNPIPSYALRLLQNLMSFRPQIAREFMSCGLLPVLYQVIEENHSNPLSQVLQLATGVHCTLIHYKETEIAELYNQGCVDLLVSVCHRLIPYIKERSDQSDINVPCITMNSVLDSIQHLLK